MALTPEDVEGKTFGTALRGYDLDEVDDFLDDVVASLRDLEDQVNAEGGVQPEAGEPTMAADESAVGRALIAAQAAGDTIISDAREESERILNDARSESETWATEREAKKAEAELEMAGLREHVFNVRTQLALLATTVADRLDEMDETIGIPAESTATGDSPEDNDADEVYADEEDVESFGLDEDDGSEAVEVEDKNDDDNFDHDSEDDSDDET